MGGKTAARQAAVAAGGPVVPGTEALPDTLAEAGLRARADEVGYPLFIKAVAGGGGRGMRRVAGPDGVAAGVESARSEAGAAFGESTVYFERLFERARHIEVQVLGDEHGNGGAVRRARMPPSSGGTRRSSRSRRRSRSPGRSGRPLADAAAALCAAVRYVNAGTLEFLLDEDGRFYFPRDEHAAPGGASRHRDGDRGGPRALADPDRARRAADLDRGRALTPQGHAIEARVYAEDPDAGFIPAPGRITFLRSPSGPGVRDDSGVEAGFTVPVHYDSMISKVVAWAPDRAGAIAHRRRALGEYEIGGTTAIPGLLWILEQDAFAAGDFDTAFLDRVLAERRGRSFSELPDDDVDVAVAAGALLGYLSGPDRPAGGESAGSTAWRRAARLEGLQR